MSFLKKVQELSPATKGELQRGFPAFLLITLVTGIFEIGLRLAEKQWTLWVILFLQCLLFYWIVIIGDRIEDVRTGMKLLKHPAATAEYWTGPSSYQQAADAVLKATKEIVAVHNWSIPLKSIEDPSVQRYYDAILKRVEGSTINYLRIFQISSMEPKPPIEGFEILKKHVEQCLQSESYGTRIQVHSCDLRFTISFLLIDEKVALVQIYTLSKDRKFYEFDRNIVIKDESTVLLQPFIEIKNNLVSYGRPIDNVSELPCESNRRQAIA